MITFSGNKNALANAWQSFSRCPEASPSSKSRRIEDRPLSF